MCRALSYPPNSAKVAAEYRCSYPILEGLLESHGEAARTQRQILLPPPDAARPAEATGGRAQPKEGPKYALEMFEEGRGADDVSLEVAALTLQGSDHTVSNARELGEAE